MILLYEKKYSSVDKEEIKQFLNQVNSLLNPSALLELTPKGTIAQPEQVSQPEEIIQPEPIAQSEQNTQPEPIELIADKEERIHLAKYLRALM